MLDRATLVFVGVIEKQTFVNWPFLRVHTQDAGDWRVLDRRVRIEAIAHGQERRKVIEVYEYSGIGGTVGNWNSTHVGRRYLFLVRNEGGSYHVVRDWWRSIFPVGSGKHDRFPLDDSSPVWERVALLQYWAQPGWTLGFPDGFLQRRYEDPGQALGLWRHAKLLRGLTLHPDARVRMDACGELISMEIPQDECAQRVGLKVPVRDVEWIKRFSRPWFEGWLYSKNQLLQLDQLRLFTTVNDRKLRQEFCEKFQRAFPNDHDNGCPAEKPPPATIVTADGDVPLTGAWPAQ